ALLAACGGSDDKPASSSSSSSSGAPEAASKREVSWTFQTGWFAQVESSAILTPMLYNTLPPNIHLTVKDGGPGQTPINPVAVWLQDKSLICQCIATNEVYAIEQAKEAYDIFLIKDIGYDSPINQIAVTDEFAAKNKDLLPSFLKAIRDGMEKALADPLPLF